MPAKGSVFANDEMKLIFNGVAIANIADNAATAPLTNLYASLHPTTPNVGGNQTTGEAAYTGYARVAVARSSAGLTVTGSIVNPTANITFPQASAGSETEAFWAIGTNVTGTGKVLYFGPISPTIAVANGVTPILTTASTMNNNA